MSKAARVLLALLLVGALAAPAAAAPKKNAKSPQETSAYWTSERMKNAKPRDRARPGGGGGGGATDWSRYAVPLAGGAYTAEDRKNGKVFFTLAGANYVCSGTAVDASAGVNLVWTAGHCVTDGPGHDATNLMFVRATTRVKSRTAGGRSRCSTRPRAGRRRAPAASATTSGPRAWSTPRIRALTFASTIGTRPILFGQSPTGKRLVSYGYPAAGKFNGSQQYACASPFRRWDGTALLDPMQISCDMTGGSSGGGWILDSNANSVGDAGEPLVSVNSYGYSFEKTTMYGPFMASGGQAQTLYNALK